MRSYILLLVCASGCDLIIVLDEPPQPVCGPYGAPVPLTFDTTLMNPKFFSTRKVAKAGDPDYGTVHATRNGITKVYIVQREPETDNWILAPGVRNANMMLMGSAGASLGEIDFATKNDEMWVWQVADPTVFI